MDELPVSTKCEFTFYTKPTSSVTWPRKTSVGTKCPLFFMGTFKKSLLTVSNKLQILVTSLEELSLGLCVLYSGGTLVFSINAKSHQ